ncbi:Fungal specific transcription factor domain-containing protein [Cladophialophora immunda]|nr:Fungal specific transcription factor domain-containing protein [Cladophialophora immunda]
MLSPAYRQLANRTPFSFYRDQNGQATLKDHGFMTEWARKAGRLVFQQPEDLHEDKIVTLMTLGLFWYSQGSWRVSQFYKGIAEHHHCTFMGVRSLFAGVACQLLYVIGLEPGKLYGNNAFESEMRRRRLWACYLMQCQSADSLSFFQPLVDLSSLSLPWPEDDFNAGVSTQPSKCLDSKGVAGESLYAEVIIGLTFWHSVHSLIKCRETDISERISALHAFDEKISRWWQQVSPAFKLTPSKVIEMANDIPFFPQILLLNAVYHQSLGALHASIIPLFSWSPGDNSWLTSRHCSAQLAFEHACTFSELVERVVSTYSRPSAIPTFVAYAAYSGCAIQIPFMWCSNPEVRCRIRANVKANIQIIQSVAVYWKFAALLQIHVGCLYEIHLTHRNTLEDEPRHIDIRKLVDFKVNASHARASILGFIDILRPKGDGFVDSGDENKDLGIELGTVRNDLPTRSSIHDGPMYDLHSGLIQQEPLENSPVALQSGFAQTTDSLRGSETNVNHGPAQLEINVNQAQYQQQAEPLPQPNQFDIESAPLFQLQDQGVTERLTLDPCYPFFDQTMLDLFPNGEMPDLSQLETDPNYLEYFGLEGWDPVQPDLPRDA